MVFHAGLFWVMYIIAHFTPIQSPCKAVVDILSSDEEGNETGSNLDGVQLSQEELIQIVTALLDTGRFLGRNCHRTILLNFYLTPTAMNRMLHVIYVYQIYMTYMMLIYFH